MENKRDDGYGPATCSERLSAADDFGGASAPAEDTDSSAMNVIAVTARMLTF
jgi:hypothetical protein